MAKIRTATSILSVLVFFSVSAFVPEELLPRERQEPQLAGHGAFIQNVGQFSGGDFLLRAGSMDYWISAGEL
jgi:hypothetical protein